MSDDPMTGNVFHRRLRAGSGRLLWLGVAMLVLGLAALLFPVFSTLVAALLVGWVLLVAGGLMLAGAFHIHGTGPFFAALLFGLLLLAAGVFLLFNPLAGAAALTLMLGILFMFQGALEIVFGFEMRPHPGWAGMLFSGIASIAMAVLIAGGWPGISTIVLGILLGVNFISTGLGYIFLSRALSAAS